MRRSGASCLCKAKRDCQEAQSEPRDQLYDFLSSRTSASSRDEEVEEVPLLGDRWSRLLGNDTKEYALQAAISGKAGTDGKLSRDASKPLVHPAKLQPRWSTPPVTTPYDQKLLGITGRCAETPQPSRLTKSRPLITKPPRESLHARSDVRQASGNEHSGIRF